MAFASTVVARVSAVVARVSTMVVVVRSGNAWDVRVV